MCDLDCEYSAEYLAAVYRDPAYGGEMGKILEEPLTEFIDGSINHATARERALEIFKNYEIAPLFSSEEWLNGFFDAEAGFSSSREQLKEFEDPDMLELSPAFELISGRYSPNPRDWKSRWQAAYEAVGGVGAHPTLMVALVDSPIWAALGNGAGGFNDYLGNPFPPFAWGSFMDWVTIPHSEAAEHGLIADD